jgi:hypothetical protein
MSILRTAIPWSDRFVMSDPLNKEEVHEPIERERDDTNVFWWIIAYCVLVLLCLIVIAGCQIVQVIVLLGKA